MEDLIIALALVFVIEGMIYALFPSAMKQMMMRVQDMSETSLRMGGLAAITFGVIAVWLIRSFN